MEGRDAERSGPTPIRVAVLSTLALAIAVVVLAVSQGGPAYFLQLGPEKPAYPHAVEVLGAEVPTPLSDGHDGIFFWELARDPLLLDPALLAVTLDRPVYRAQRIGYPLLAAPWRAFGEGALLWGMVVTNLVAVFAGTLATARWSAGRGGRASVGYLFAAFPLVWLGLLFDFGEVVALAALVVALSMHEQRRTGVASVAGIVAALSREPMLAPLAFVALFGRGRSWRDRAALVVPAGVAAAAWRLYATSRLEDLSSSEIVEFRAVPFAGLADAVRVSWTLPGDLVQAAMAVVLLGAGVVAFAAWARDRSSVVLAAAAPFGLLGPFLSVFVVSLWHNLIRGIGPAAFFLALHLATPRRRRRGATTE